MTVVEIDDGLSSVGVGPHPPETSDRTKVNASLPSAMESPVGCTVTVLADVSGDVGVRASLRRQNWRES